MSLPYLQDGTIGPDLVIRPLPLKYRNRKPAGVQQFNSGSRDDEMFMDDEDFRSADPTALLTRNDEENEIHRQRRKKRVAGDDDGQGSGGGEHSIGSHIVYKRPFIQSESDYGKWLLASPVC